MNMHTGSGIVRRATIDEIAARRDRALELYGVAHQALEAAGAALAEAHEAARQASGSINRYNHHSEAAKKCFFNMKVPARSDFMDTARRLTDIDVWAHVIAMTDLERLMDKTAKDQLSAQLVEDPPEASADNIFATLDQFMSDADTIFRRGIATCFSALDRRFRSHDGFKIGSRVILDYAFSDTGYWCYHSNKRDALQDIERTFWLLDGKAPPPNYAGIIGQIEAERRGTWGPRASEHHNDYFKVCAYKNGNAHIWFKRDDLVEKVNRLLGEYYGEVIPDGRPADDDGDLFKPKTGLAKNYGFFPTPEDLAASIVSGLPLYRDRDAPQLTCLEPSAGTGNLARLIARDRSGDYSGRYREEGRFDAAVDCIEIQTHLAEALKDEGIYRRVICADFLAVQPDPARLYDLVVMNPPFDRERDIDHVVHAMRFLKPDGCLTAIMSAGTEFRETRKAVAFRKMIDELGGIWRDLPAGSFASVGTYCNTVLLRLRKDGGPCRW